jgi:hypothetical protein
MTPNSIPISSSHMSSLEVLIFELLFPLFGPGSCGGDGIIGDAHQLTNELLSRYVFVRLFLSGVWERERGVFDAGR